MKEPIHILFLCVANSARSQLAEGLVKAIFGAEASVESAGSDPSGKVHPWAVKTLKDDGIDISMNRSKSIDQISPRFLEKLDVVVTLCAEEICPSLPTQAKRLHWPLRDPAAVLDEEKPEAFRIAKDEIKSRLYELKASLSRIEPK